MGRLNIERASVIAVFDGVTLHSSAPFSIAHGMGSSPVEVLGMGTVDYTETGEVYDDVTFTPVGKYSYKSILHPYSGAALGSSMFGDDQPLKLYFSNGKSRTYASAAVISSPRLSGSPQRSLWGPVTFRCIRGQDSSPTDADSLYVDNDEDAFPGFSDLVNTDMIRQSYAVAWAAGTDLASFRTEDGFEFSVAIKGVSNPNDYLGMGDMTFDGLTTEVTLKPYGINPSAILSFLKRQGAGAGGGRSMSATGHDLVITGSGVTITIPKAVISTTASQYGGGQANQGAITFRGTREHATGTLRAFYTLG